MKGLNRIGIYMDHSIAHLIEFTSDPIETKSITSDFNHVVKETTLKKSESLMHNREQHEQADYFKHLGNVILKYENVVLFGPTHAKEELANLLKADHHFDKIMIKVHHSDKMTENQQHAFVKEYFSMQLVSID